MRSRLSAVLMAALLTGCSGAETLVRSFASVEKVCPNGVLFFTSANRVPGKYREVALLSIQGVMGREEAKRAGAMYRQHAGDLGANAIVLSSRIGPEAGAKVIGPAIGDPSQRRGMAVAIYIPADSSRVNEICRPAGTPAPDGSAVASRQVVGTEELMLVAHTAPRSPAGRSVGFHRGRAPIRAFDLSGRKTSAVEWPEATDTSDSTAFIRNQDVRSALTNLERLHFVTDAEEVRPGLVRLSMMSVAPRAPMEYHMSFLHGSYQAALPYGAHAVVELWSKGSKLGEYTKEGLVVGADQR